MSGRPKGGANRRFSKEDKLIILSDYLEKGMTQIEVITKYGIAVSLFRKWVNRYKEFGPEGLEYRKPKGNPYAALYRKKNLTELERLELENLKLKVENERLKKGYTKKEVIEVRAGLSKKNLK
ncbi:MAG: helix-turn-helix domain-containing protein [Acholeplasmataceae bacterium]|jgi:transposase-like protein|nr:helix-turn-helix domain-containing protein [Acholeplasmataceae bacterium]